MRLIAGEFLAWGELFEDFHGNVLKSLVNEFFADLEIEGGQRIGMFDGGFVGFAAHRDERGAEIHKGIVAASAVHDVSGAPKRPGIGGVDGLVEVGLPCDDFRNGQVEEFLLEQGAFFVHVAFGGGMNAVDEIPELINSHQEEKKRNGEIAQGPLATSLRLYRRKLKRSVDSAHTSARVVHGKNQT